jgi:hypothetical protein
MVNCLALRFSFFVVLPSIARPPFLWFQHPLDPVQGNKAHTLALHDEHHDLPQKSFTLPSARMRTGNRPIDFGGSKRDVALLCVRFCSMLEVLLLLNPWACALPQFHPLSHDENRFLA